MTFSLDLNQTRSLSNLKQHDIIEFESQFINRDIFMVVSIEKNDEIPAILLQLWQFEGGYNHALKNVMENDLGINKQVPYFEPRKQLATIQMVTSYRPQESGYSKKEELFFDIWPKETSPNRNDDFPIPYEVKLKFEDGATETLRLPSWTPLQRLPINRIQKTTEVEVWTIEGTTNIMKVTQL